MAAIRFLHKGRIREIRDPDPTLTVLRWLREQEGLTGTKEGCAEGDCGACSVVFGTIGPDNGDPDNGDPDNRSIRYRAVNACIVFLPVLDGKQLITLEDLGTADDLHKVQRALVETHSSQCGFCTPGFVMSLFAQYHDPETGPGEVSLADALAGNLCRCTGYRPILDAGRKVLDAPPTDGFATRRDADAALLASIRRIETLSIESHGRTYHAPQDLDALAALVEADPAARLLAGGTDLGLEVTKARNHPNSLIYIGDVPELAAIEETKTGLTIGAGVTFRDAMPQLVARYPETAELFRRFGAVQVRNLGTIGGNIANASPIGDTPPLMLALDAQLVLRKGTTTRRLPLDEFFLDYRKTAIAPAEFIVAVELPPRHADDRLAVYKLSKRFDQDISSVCAAFRLRLDKDRIVEARLAFGGMAAKPKRAAAAEAALAGRLWGEAAAQAAAAALAQDFTPLTDFRATAAYRLLAAQNLVHKFYLETTAPEIATRVLEYV
ncbi:MAG: xanthine dehydrogenase small subunit [Alphaproteobacteria bacterium]|nr:xanthine dehydrogenase small subunit [Alphaproteobacteria bacterium]